MLLLIIKGSPLTFLTDSVINKLLPPNQTLEGDSFSVEIHGKMQAVQKSDAKSHNFNGINLLGTDYLLHASLVLTADYVNFKVMLDQGKKEIKYLYLYLYIKIKYTLFKKEMWKGKSNPMVISRKP